MRLFILLACVLGAAVARPEAGFPYSAAQMDLSQNVHQQQLPREQQALSFAEPQLAYGAPEEQMTLAEPLPLDQMPAMPYFAPQQQQQIEQQPPQADSYNMAYLQSSLPHVSGYSYAPQKTTVHKHIYVHVPPRDFEEEDAVQPRVVHQGGPKQKHYKIVFIKAPAAPQVRPPVVPPPPQNEEKTLIYVLHKKPEEVQDIVVPTAAPTQPSKPEVFFIKYKTKKEEAPVYGPPPQTKANDVDARYAELPAAEYGAPLAGDMLAGEEMVATTTVQPAVEEAQPQQALFNAEAPSQLYEAPTMSSPVEEMTQQSHAAEEPQTTMAPIVVEEQPHHMPSASYGPPQRYFLKKRK